MGAVTVIAEAGVNHNGSLDLALRLVDAAADAGADVVKFQTFRSDQLTTPTAGRSAYQIRNTGTHASQREMLRGLELDGEAHERLLWHCVERGIEFLSTPFDFPSLDLLTDGLGLRRLKIGSGDLTNAPMLLAVANRRVDLILSTGMATLDEIEQALGILAFGYAGAGAPSRDGFEAAYATPEGRKALRNHVVILHCTSDYPAKIDDINLKAMDTLSTTFGLPVGFSDHSEGIMMAVAAIAKGAVALEKHLTLDRTLPGPDHLASIEPREFKSMVTAIREVERAQGDGRKVPAASELNTIPAARKSLVARVPICRGEPFTAENLCVKRPGTGLAPIHFWNLVGRRASRDYAAEELIGEAL
jgi:N-acetylneuraminate synthase